VNLADVLCDQQSIAIWIDQLQEDKVHQRVLNDSESAGRSHWPALPHKGCEVETVF